MKGHCPNLFLPFLKNINIGNLKLIPVFDDSHRKNNPVSGDGSDLEVPCKGALLGRREREEGNASSDARQIFNATIRSSRNYRHSSFASWGKLRRSVTLKCKMHLSVKPGHNDKEI